AARTGAVETRSSATAGLLATRGSILKRTVALSSAACCPAHTERDHGGRNTPATTPITTPAPLARARPLPRSDRQQRVRCERSRGGLQAFPSLEKGELEQHAETDHGPAGSFDQSTGRGGGASRGEDVVDDHCPLARPESVTVHLEGLLAVFQAVGLGVGLGR